jgi:hypothetical protein
MKSESAKRSRVKPELLRLNVDAQVAISIVLSALPQLRALRPQFVAELPSVDIRRFDRLEDYALALRFSHQAVQSEVPNLESGTALRAEAINLRNILLADTRALAQRAVIDPRKLEALAGGIGYTNLAHDLDLLRRILRSKWSVIARKSAVTAEDLRAASSVARGLLRIVKTRTLGTPKSAGAVNHRRRAFTLLSNAYAEARAGVAYLRRRHRDANDIAPSLHGGMRFRRIILVPKYNGSR